MEPILSVKDLSVSFQAFAGTVHAVRDVNFDLMKGETLAIVGESGSGKSVTIKAILGILAKNGHIDSGSILYQGEDMAKYKENKIHNILTAMKKSNIIQLDSDNQQISNWILK